MPYPFWNKNADANVVCWLCEHFQRRDSTEATQNCQGECRKKPINFGGILRNITQAAAGDMDGAFAAVPFGNTNWCSGFQASLEENIPEVVEGRLNCADQNLDDWESPRDNMIGPSPRENKKNIEETCWYCEHFQRDPEAVNPGNRCTGYCFIQPPDLFQYQNSDWGTGGFDEMEHWYANQQVTNSAYMWCSQWAKSRTAVPDPPEFGGVICQGGA